MLPTWQCSVNFKTYFTPSPQRTDWNVPQQALNIKKSWGFQIGKHPIYLVLVERVEWKNDSWIWLENGSDITVQWSRTEGGGSMLLNFNPMGVLRCLRYRWPEALRHLEPQGKVLFSHRGKDVWNNITISVYQWGLIPGYVFLATCSSETKRV